MSDPFQALAAIGTLALAVVTFLSLRELRSQRYELARPFLLLTFNSDSTVMVENEGTGWAYQIDVQCRAPGVSDSPGETEREQRRAPTCGARSGQIGQRWNLS